MLTANRIRPYATPWNLFNQMHDEINRELSGWLSSASMGNQHALGVWTKDNDALVAIELPGHDPEDFDVAVRHNILTIEAKSPADDLPEGVGVLRRERSGEEVQRQVQLPFELDPQSVEATYQRGLLVVRLSAHESALPAKIEVKAG